MNQVEMKRLFDTTDYIRIGGTEKELECANFIKSEIEKLGVEAHFESFKVQSAEISECELTCSLGSIICKGYRNSDSTSKDGLTAPLYYLKGRSEFELSKCKGKIVLIIGYFGRFFYEDLLKHGAVGFITTTGIQTDSHDDIDNRELRGAVQEGLGKIPGVNINIKDAMRLVENDVKEVTLRLIQTETIGHSQNIVAEIKGRTDEVIAFSAHYDSVPLSHGVYDNMSGAVGIFAIMEKFLENKVQPRYTLRFIWCGCEERGLLGSKAYTAMHDAELDKVKLNINLDMIGSILGCGLACCTTEIKLVHYLEYMSLELGYSLVTEQGVYSSDSTPFADHKVPAMSFARLDPHDMSIIHNRYDTFAQMSIKHMFEDIDFIYAFAKRLDDAVFFPIGREIPEKLREEIDKYLLRKRPETKVE